MGAHGRSLAGTGTRRRPVELQWRLLEKETDALRNAHAKRGCKAPHEDGTTQPSSHSKRVCACACTCGLRSAVYGAAALRAPRSASCL